MPRGAWELSFFIIFFLANPDIVLGGLFVGLYVDYLLILFSRQANHLLFIF
jgi:hypothetical protein